MVEVVGVRYRDAGHIYYFAPGDSEYVYSDKVLVESQQSLHIATVVLLKKRLIPMTFLKLSVRSCIKRHKLN